MAVKRRVSICRAQKVVSVRRESVRRKDRSKPLISVNLGSWFPERLPSISERQWQEICVDAEAVIYPNQVRLQRRSHDGNDSREMFSSVIPVIVFAHGYLSTRPEVVALREVQVVSGVAIG